MNGPPPPLVQELAALGYALTHALYTEAKELLVKEGLSPRRPRAPPDRPSGV